MKFLTREQQRILAWILTLLLVGWAVKSYRLAHPPAQPALVR